MKPFTKPPAGEMFSDWPKVGETIVDDIGRRLHVVEVNPKDPVGRHVVGVLTGGVPYACDVVILTTLWGRP